MLDKMSLEEIVKMTQEYSKLKAPNSKTEEEENESGRRRANILYKGTIKRGDSCQ